jgi:L-seryl-tRNA(Ser) seleniumtransferase
LRVHTSNYQIIGFASEVPLSQLVQLAAKHQLPLMDDIGSGCLIDFRKYGLPEEPMVQESIKAGADVVTFSGDKILGGPQCGIIIGKKFDVDLIRKNPLTRALRCGKLTFTALEATLKLYLDEETLPEKHPVLKMLTTPIKELKNRARAFQRHFQDSLRKVCELAVIDGFSQMGSGSLPAKNIPSVLIALKPINMSADELAKKLRTQKPSVFTRIEADLVLLDFRTIAPDEVKLVEEAVLRIFEL